MEYTDEQIRTILELLVKHGETLTINDIKIRYNGGKNPEKQFEVWDKEDRAFFNNTEAVDFLFS